MAKLRRYATASLAEIAQLKKMLEQTEALTGRPLSPSPAVNRVDSPGSQPPKPPGPQLNESVDSHKTPRAPKLSVFETIQNAQVTREPLKLDNPVALLVLLMPELTPYRWQFEELMRMAGYLETGNYKDKSEITPELPYKLVLSAANGSGKDMIMIAVFAVWFMLTGARNRVIITSSSFDQTKFQTEPHIRELCNRANKLFGKLIEVTQFHYVCPELGSEIKLYATDEEARAEGYHPFPGGSMAIVINEAKSVRQAIFNALGRCTGYSYWIEVSSPGHRSGHMYKAAQGAVKYPDKAVLSKFYHRRVTAWECPHLPRSHIESMIYDYGESSPLVQSSIFANFSDFEEPVIITEWYYDKCAGTKVDHIGNDIGIGLDIAGGGDEDSLWVRRGNKIIFNYHFRQIDTMLAVDLIDRQLQTWKNDKYTFNADNGGLGQAVIDRLKEKGWKILRRNNQSPAFNKREFLNLGAEMWFHTKRLIERCDILLPNVPKLKDQLTSRYYKGMASTQGKFALESKEEARLNGHTSPDRADGFVLCMYSYRTKRNLPNPPANSPSHTYTKRLVTNSELIEAFERGEVKRHGGRIAPVGRFSFIGTKI